MATAIAPQVMAKNVTTVQQLINFLQTQPLDAIVYIPSYTGSDFFPLSLTSNQPSAKDCYIDIRDHGIVGKCEDVDETDPDFASQFFAVRKAIEFYPNQQ